MDAIVVLGGDVAQRLPMAVELFQAGLAPELWYTGATEESLANSRGEIPRVVQAAQELGIPAEAITLLATTSTWEDGREIAATVQARGTRSILVVTPGFGPGEWWQVESGQRVITQELRKIILCCNYYNLNLVDMLD